MATFTLTFSPYPPTTAVKAYLAAQRVADQGPSGSEVASATAGSDTSVAFTGLVDDTAYVAYAVVGGRHLYVGFRTAPAAADAGAGGGGDVLADGSVPFTGDVTFESPARLLMGADSDVVTLGTVQSTNENDGNIGASVDGDFGASRAALTAFNDTDGSMGQLDSDGTLTLQVAGGASLQVVAPAALPATPTDQATIIAVLQAWNFCA